jgi:hypothetical protein
MLWKPKEARILTNFNEFLTNFKVQNEECHYYDNTHQNIIHNETSKHVTQSQFKVMRKTAHKP